MKKLLFLLLLPLAAQALTKYHFNASNTTGDEIAVKVYRLHPVTQSHILITPQWTIIKNGNSARFNIDKITTEEESQAGDYHLHLLYAQNGTLLNEKTETGEPISQEQNITIEESGQTIDLVPFDVDELYEEDYTEENIPAAFS